MLLPQKCSRGMEQGPHTGSLFKIILQPLIALTIRLRTSRHILWLQGFLPGHTAVCKWLHLSSVSSGGAAAQAALIHRCGSNPSAENCDTSVMTLLSLCPTFVGGLHDTKIRESAVPDQWTSPIAHELSGTVPKIKCCHSSVSFAQARGTESFCSDLSCELAKPRPTLMSWQPCPPCPATLPLRAIQKPNLPTHPVHQTQQYPVT